MSPRIAVLSFPGTNGDTENLRTLKRTGFDPFVFRWNDDREKLKEVDGYFIGAGFAYEDRGRAGMVAARDSLFHLLHEEAEKGKVIVGHCNGCQVLVESGLIPLGKGLQMCMARNVVENQESRIKNQVRAVGFLNEWIWIKRTCARDRCATSAWDGVMQIPIAHGEGRFVTKDKDLITELEKNDQIAFRYCDAEGNVSSEAPVTPNGSTDAIAGICNPAGNVVAIMPHPERTTAGDPYFRAMREWMIKGKSEKAKGKREEEAKKERERVFDPRSSLQHRASHMVEIFIDTIIVNNEERTVEKTAQKYAPELSLKQMRYLAPTARSPEEILGTISIFNPNKEVAFVRRDGAWFAWQAVSKTWKTASAPLREWTLLRRDEPDTGAPALGKGSETGICSTLSGVSEAELNNQKLLDIFGNPHASTLELLKQ